MTGGKLRDCAPIRPGDAISPKMGRGGVRHFQINYKIYLFLPLPLKVPLCFWFRKVGGYPLDFFLIRASLNRSSDFVMPVHCLMSRSQEVFPDQLLFSPGSSPSWSHWSLAAVGIDHNRKTCSYFRLLISAQNVSWYKTFNSESIELS